jgi:RimJ/RimL family protein N-acetyltransferase
MDTIRIETWLAAPIERCFDAARDLDLHLESMAYTGERAIAGRMSGLIGLDEEVTWRGKHFGITQDFTSRITRFDRPRYFQDSMQRGAFRSFVHDHYFSVEEGKTKMVDALAYAAPLGFLGWIAERLFLRRHLVHLLEERAAVIKRAVETHKVVLRDVTSDDLPILFEQQFDPVANEMAAFPARERSAFMAHWETILRDETGPKKAILFDGSLAGYIVAFDQAGEREIGYWLGREYWGKGIATLALTAFLQQVTTRPLFAHVARHNAASIRVLEKCGFSRDREEAEEVVLVLRGDHRSR